MGFWDGLSKSFQLSKEHFLVQNKPPCWGEGKSWGSLLSTINIFALQQTPTTTRSIKMWKILLVLPNFQIK